jgi:hypothetical protein
VQEFWFQQITRRGAAANNQQQSFTSKKQVMQYRKSNLNISDYQRLVIVARFVKKLLFYFISLHFALCHERAEKKRKIMRFKLKDEKLRKH